MKYYKYTYKTYWIYLITFITLIIFLLLPKEVLLATNSVYIELIVMLAIFIIHELLHGLGFRIFGKAKWQNIVYGIKLESGIFYCACKEEIDKKGIIISLMFPIIFLTLIPFIVGSIMHLNIFILVSVINLLGASFDILATIDILKLPSDIRYKDLDDSLSFILISDKDLNMYNHIGLTIMESGNYNSSKIKAKNYSKVLITKPSIIIFIIIFILLIIGFML